MKNIKNSIITLLALILIVLGLNSCSVNNELGNIQSNQLISVIKNYNESPQKTFLSAWKAIKYEYLDPTFNDQDWTRWKDRYIDQIKTKDDAYLAIDTMLESLNDPYTRFLSPSDFEEQDRNIEAKLFGIGVHIAPIRNLIVVIETIEDTPAKKAGLRPGDIILKIGQKSTKGLDIRKVADMVRGKAGSNVILTIKRDNKMLVKNIKREQIKIKSVKYKMLKDNYAYIKIITFISSDTSREMLNALEKTKNAKGIILDLRGNYGGLLPNAVLIANMFIDQGPIVSIIDRQDYKEVINAESNEVVTEKPLVVLIDGASASASEILSGALKDHNRAVLVGEKTFGKGLVQKIENLPDGSGLNITIAKYLTPNGIDINKKGIEPDFKVNLTGKDILAGKDPQLAKAKQVILLANKK